MKKEPLFTPVDLHSWKRGQMFYYFYKSAPTGYSLTVDVDITPMKAALDAAGLKFFPAWLWLVTKTLNRQQAFKMAEKDGVIGFYDWLTPLYASFHGDDGTFSFMWTEYDEDLFVFYNSYLENQRLYGENRGVLAQPDRLPPPNAYTVSCIPWVSFSHFSVHSYENKPYFFPSVEAGKFTEKDGRLQMPLSLTCHHAATDGYHIKCFFEQLQEEIDRFEKYLDAFSL